MRRGKHFTLIEPLVVIDIIAALLIAKRAEVNAKNQGGRTPLTFADKNGHSEIAELLRKHGVKQ
jgi:ankyrin repeat protein